MRLAMAIAVLFNVYWPHALVAQEIYVTEKGGSASYRGRTLQTETLEKPLSSAAPGSRIILLPGIYSGEYVIKRSGNPGQPIVISGTQDEKTGESSAIIDGKRPKSHEEGSPCFLLKEVEWVTFENLKVKNCWPSFILAKDSRYIALRSSVITDSRYVLYAKGEKSRHFLIENNRWTQDPSHAIWKDLSWEELHHGKYVYFNGALFGSKNISGDVTFRGNEISYAYNGIRMVADASEFGKKNSNVQIYNNHFKNIRDNPIEPEGTATHWWIHHNRIQNGYAWFSFTELDAQEIYVFGNVGWFDDRPCRKPVKDGHCRGKVFKFEATGPFPSGHIYVFHNSWYTPSPLITDGQSRNFHHWNNAIFFAGETKQFFDQAEWHSSYEFDHDLSNVSFDEVLKKSLQEKNGKVGDPGFRNPKAGDFQISAQSPAVDAGKTLSLLDWKSNFQGKAPDIGAFEGDKPFQGPNFRQAPGSSEEDPAWQHLYGLGSGKFAKGKQ